MTHPAGEMTTPSTSIDQEEAMRQFYAAAFEAGRKQGFAEGVQAAKDFLELMTVSPMLAGRSSTPLNTPIEELGLGTRICGLLGRIDVHTVGDLIQRSQYDLMDIRYFGLEWLKKVHAELAARGYRLAPNPPGEPLLI